MAWPATTTSVVAACQVRGRRASAASSAALSERRAGFWRAGEGDGVRKRMRVTRRKRKRMMPWEGRRRRAELANMTERLREDFVREGEASGFRHELRLVTRRMGLQI